VEIRLVSEDGTGRTEDDASLVRRTLGGDFSAYEELFIRHKGKVFTVAFYITGKKEDAEDVCQDVFLQLIGKLGSFDQRRAFSAWLSSVAANAAKDHARRQKRRPQAPREEIDFSCVPRESLAFQEEGIGRGPEEVLLEEEKLLELVRAIGLLPVKLRLPLVLHDISEIQYDEIARTLELPMGTVKSRISRARVALGNILTKGT